MIVAESGGPAVYLDALTAADCDLVRHWRNQSARDTLRTPVMLTTEMQAEFYREIVCNRHSLHRYFAMVDSSAGRRELVAMGGLTNIAWEDGITEISLIVDPQRQRRGIGRAAVQRLLDEAFGRLRLSAVYGEVYQCNPAVDFWRRIVDEHGGSVVVLPVRKFALGRHWDSLYFTIRAPKDAG